MQGALVLVVGPSGAGKDTLIGLARAQLRDEPRYVFPRRAVTRPPSANEDNEEIASDAFDQAAAEGRFALSWRAHGLGYGIRAEAAALAADGRVVVCNVSRTVCGEARQRWPNVHVVEITAPREVLARRLAARGRREDGDLGARLGRSGAVAPDITIVNDGPPSTGTERLVAFLRRTAGL